MGKKVFRYPDNWKPNRVVIKERDGRTDIFHNFGSSSAHGHSVIDNGEHVYSRTQGGYVVLDIPRSRGVCPKCGKPI